MLRNKKVFLSLGIPFLIFFFIFGCLEIEDPNKSNIKSFLKEKVEEENKNKMKIISPAFKDGDYLNPKYTCMGENINPPLEFVNVPANTKSLVLIVSDPDAPSKSFIHWVVFNLDPNSTGIEEGKHPNANFGLNDYGTINWKGPCPPSGTHRYYFYFFALKEKLPLKDGATQEQISKEMQGKILAIGQIMGKFAR